MKRLFLLSVFFFIGTVCVYAQDKPEKQLFKWDQATMDAIGFTPEQVLHFKEIQKETNLASIAISKDSTLSEEQKKEKMKALVAERSAKQHAVLTPEQLKKTVELKKKIRAANAAAGY